MVQIYLPVFVSYLQQLEVISPCLYSKIIELIGQLDLLEIELCKVAREDSRYLTVS